MDQPAELLPKSEVLSAPLSPAREVEGNDPLHFRQAVEINGLPYVFEGDAPTEPANFSWYVSVPNWEEQRPGTLERMADGRFSPHFYGTLEGHGLGNGRVGRVVVQRADPKDNMPAVRLDEIAADTLHLPEEFGYNDARGVGSFLLDNLCSLADIRDWRIYINPIDMGWGNLTQGDLMKWYQKRGFTHDFQFPIDSRMDGGTQRRPRELDVSQAIVDILQPQSS